MRRGQTVAFAALFLAGLSCGGQAAELPSQAGKAATARESAQALKKCNIGGIVGVVAASGVCVRMSGSVSAGFEAGRLK